MTLPDEITNPIVNFWNQYKWNILLVIVSVIIGYASIIFLGDDNVIEEDVEILIEKETGIPNINLTPKK